MRKGTRVYALYPNTSSLYPGTVVNSTMYTRGEDDIVVVEFDDDMGKPTRYEQHAFTKVLMLSLTMVEDSGETPNRHIPARFVTMMPKESPSFKRRRKSTASKKRKSQVISSPPGTGPSTPMTPPHQQTSDNTSVDRMLLEMLAGAK